MINSKAVKTGKISHVILYSDTRKTELPYNLFNHLWFELVSLGITLKEKSQVKFIIYDNKESIFYENESSLSLYHDFIEVYNLIERSYDKMIECVKDRNSGWDYSKKNGWKFNEKEWLENVKRDFTLEDYLNNSTNDNSWIVTIFLPTMRFIRHVRFEI